MKEKVYPNVKPFNKSKINITGAPKKVKPNINIGIIISIFFFITSNNKFP